MRLPFAISLMFLLFGAAAWADIADLMGRPEEGEQMLTVSDLHDSKDRRSADKLTRFAISEYTFGPFVHSLKSDTNQIEDWYKVRLAPPAGGTTLPMSVGGFPTYYQSVRLKHSCAARFWSASLLDCAGIADAEFDGESCKQSMDKARATDPELRQQMSSCGTPPKVTFSPIEEVFGFSATPLSREALGCAARQVSALETALRTMPKGALEKGLSSRRGNLSVLDKAACLARLQDDEICNRKNGRIAVRVYEFSNVRSASLERAVARADIGETRKVTDEFKLPVISVNAVLTGADCRILDVQTIIRHLSK